MALFQRAQASPGEVVFVHGASGGVGIASVQLVRAAGMTVIGSASTEQGQKLAAAQGAHHVVNHKAPGYLDEVLKLTNGRGVDVVIEMLSNVNLANDINVLAQGGRVVMVGNRGPNNQGTVEINPRAAMQRDAAILGMTLVNVAP
jgi:NADPH2:quinone reductase